MSVKVGDQQRPGTEPRTSQCVDWLSVGQGRVVELNGRLVTVRLVGRKGRRARVAIEAPAGAVFRAQDDG
jgi:hypothetical protein